MNVLFFQDKSVSVLPGLESSVLLGLECEFLSELEGEFFIRARV